MFKLYLTVQILSTLLGVSSTADYLTEPPNWLRPCKINEPDFTECTTNTIQEMLIKMSSEGIPGLKSFTGIDPYRLNQLNIDQGGDGPLNLKIKLANITVTGFRSVKVKESRFKPQSYAWESKIFLPSLKLDGSYAVQGRILVLPLNSEGKVKLHIENMDMKVRAKSVLYEKDDFIFINVTSVKIDYKMQGIKIKMDNLFNGNKELEDSANALFNENWEVLADTLKPAITGSVERLYHDIFTRLFHQIPANFFIEDIK